MKHEMMKQKLGWLVCYQTKVSETGYTLCRTHCKTKEEVKELLKDVKKEEIFGCYKIRRIDESCLPVRYDITVRYDSNGMEVLPKWIRDE